MNVDTPGFPVLNDLVHVALTRARRYHPVGEPSQKRKGLSSSVVFFSVEGGLFAEEHNAFISHLLKPTPHPEKFDDGAKVSTDFKAVVNNN